MCTELLPPGGYPTAVKYIIYHLGKITGQHSRPQFHLSLLRSLASYGRGGAWRRKWERLKSRGGGQGSHNKPIGCGASGAFAPGPDDEKEEVLPYFLIVLRTILLAQNFFFFFFRWRYSPLWALACRKIPLHYSLSFTNSLHLLTPNTWRFLSTLYLTLNLPASTTVGARINP